MTPLSHGLGIHHLVLLHPSSLIPHPSLQIARHPFEDPAFPPCIPSPTSHCCAPHFNGGGSQPNPTPVLFFAYDHHRLTKQLWQQEQTSRFPICHFLTSIEDGPSLGSSATSSRSFQRLPDEVLLLVVDCLHDDLKTLTTLLVVNKFLFKAALPLIYRNPFQTWELNYKKSPHFKKKGRMMALILSSLLKYQSQRSEEPARVILARMGLRQVEPVRYQELEMDSPRNTRETGESGLPTVDYSTYYTSYSLYDFRTLDFRRLLRLERLPTFMREQIPFQEAPDRVDDTDILNIESDNQMEETHTNEQQLDEDYRMALLQSLLNLLLYYNHDFVTEMSMHTMDAGAFLAKVDKMVRLSSITLHRDDSLPDDHLRNITLGILLHRAAFPGKPALKVKFHSGWHHLHFTAPDLDVSEIMLIRRGLQLPQTIIYQALARPVAMMAGEFQHFYHLCQGVELDHLRSFTDEYLDRYDNGEGPAREAFLKSCTALENLRLGVGTPYDLSWAAQYALSGVSTVNSLSVHPKLRGIALTSYRPIRFLVLAMNDALTAYAGSLRSITAYSNSYSEDRVGVPVDLQNARRSLERRLRTSPLACTIGDWILKLPCLTSLDFVFSGGASISIGSLSQCPNLESLNISFGDRPREHEVQDDDEEIYGPLTSLQDPQGMGDGPPGQQPIQTLPERQPSAEYIKKITTLFPKWTLPRLRKLRLLDSAALRFNYESLNSMQALESLELKVYDRDTLLMKYRHRIPKLDAHESRPAPSAKNQGSLIEQGDEDSAVWTTTWHLPYLKKLHMEGPPAHVFNIGWLKACPQLSTVRLATWGSPQRIPLHAHSALSYSIPAAPEPTRRETRATTAPLLDSVLEFIFLEGPWMMTRGDMVELLTVYAPHLQKLNVGVLNDRETVKGCGYRTIKAISMADAINKAYIEQNVPEYLELLKAEYRKQDSVDSTEQDDKQEEEEEEEDEQRSARLNRLLELARLVPGQKLFAVKSEYRVSKWGCRDLGLESWDVGFKKQQSARRNSKGKVQIGLRRAPRVYKFSGQELWHLES